MDYFQGEDVADWRKALHTIRSLTQGHILLATWRQKKEGGVRECDGKTYETLVSAIIESQEVDLVDVELFNEEATVKRLVDIAHTHHVGVVMSNHDHHATPSKEAMLIRLRAMQKMGADIVKLAVMPQCVQDVYHLLEVSSQYRASKDHCLMITMAMGPLGFVSRICGEMSGSIMSFAALNKASAPGQIPWQKMREMLDLFHEGYGDR